MIESISTLLPHYNENDVLPSIELYNKTREWYKNGSLHSPSPKRFRENDLPAIEYFGGGKKWYQNGKLHRDNGLPAIESFNCRKWYKEGQLYRDHDLPTIETHKGDKEWHKGTYEGFDLVHRDNDKPAIEYANGDKGWYQHGKRHSPSPKGSEITNYLPF